MFKVPNLLKKALTGKDYFKSTRAAECPVQVKQINCILRNQINYEIPLR
jgi:hypothetical protein